jgi:hypothetical protein
VRNDCTVGKLSERNEAGDEEAIRRRNRSCMSGVRVAQPWSELYVRSRKWTVPLHYVFLAERQRTMHAVVPIHTTGEYNLFESLLESGLYFITSTKAPAAVNTA